jgi:aryl sulfotransferase
MNKGTNGRWRDVLSEADVARYEREARNRLGGRLAEWLAEGGPLPLTAAYARDLAEVR